PAVPVRRGRGAGAVPQCRHRRSRARHARLDREAAPDHDPRPMMTILAVANPLDHVLPHPVFHIGGFAVTNHLIMTMVAAALVLLTFWWVSGRVRTTGPDAEGHLTKGAVAQLFETMCVFIRDNV